MSTEHPAVFLSYASQDAPAARRICEALRAAGLEVWFDQNELRGGDAWDASIRRQVKECALFVPLISANTEARSEGYFRLEWKLAVERTHLMADDHAFLLPVVIDDTPEASARVPDAFRARQWSRLPGGEVSTKFCDHVRRLLGASPAPGPAAGGTGTADSRAANAVKPSRTARPLAVLAAIGLAGVLSVAVLLAWQPWKASAPADSAPRRPAPPSPASAPAASESVAVLPFSNLSPDKENEYFADGISEELLNVLARVPGLRVSARTASFRFKGKDTPVQEIARQLGVSYLIEGSVRKAGSTVRITAQLVKGVDGFQAWSETFDRDLKDIFAVQDEIARRVAQALRLKIEDAKDEKLAAGGTRNAAAYEAYLKGARISQNVKGPSDVRESERLLKQAVDLDPKFALAHGALAEIYISLGLQGAEPRDKIFPLAKAAAERALALDPRVVQAYNALGEYEFHYAWEWEESDRQFRKALALDPNYYWVHVHLASHEMARNRLDSALGSAIRAKEADPFNRASAMIYILSRIGRHDEAIRLAREYAAERPLPHVRIVLGQVLVDGGQRDEGLRVLEEAARTAPPDQANDALESLAEVYGRTGQAEKARPILERLLANRTNPSFPTDLARIYAALDDRDKAMAQLEKAYEQHNPSMPFIGLIFAKYPIARDPRFRSLLKRMKLDVYFPEPAAR